MSTSTLQRLFQIDIVDAQPQQSWNIAPTQTIPLIAGSHPERRLTTARWSLVPPWSPELKLSYPTFNARIETAAQKRTFAASVVSKRCVIPFDGYYEWRKEGGENVPHFVSRTDGHPLSLAGLYSWWQSPEDRSWHLTATVLTCAAVGGLASLHDRMPVLVPPAQIDDWLNPERAATQAELDALAGAQPELVDALHVIAVNPLRGDGPECIAPRGNTPSP